MVREREAKSEGSPDPAKTRTFLEEKSNGEASLTTNQEIRGVPPGISGFNQTEQYRERIGQIEVEAPSPLPVSNIMANNTQRDQIVCCVGASRSMLALMMELKVAGI